MALALDDLLAPVSEDEPSGPDLAYDSVRYEIEQAFESTVSIDASGIEASAADVDWRSIISKIVAQSAQTKDVWLAVYLARAGARSGDLQTAEIGAEYLAGLLENFWPTVHPQLEEYGYQGRKGPCDSLAGLPQFLNPLLRMKVLRHARLGEYSAADFERFRAGGDSEDGYGMFRAAVEDIGQEGLDEIVARVDAILSAIKRADTVLTANAEDSGGGTNFQPTYDTLNQMKRALLAFGSAPVEEEAPQTAGETEAFTGGGSGGGARLSGKVESREDVIRAIDAIAEYYRRKEPAHPMIMLLGRAREWVSLDFIEILRDIVPSSLDEARNVLLSRTQRESE